MLRAYVVREIHPRTRHAQRRRERTGKKLDKQVTQVFDDSHMNEADPSLAWMDATLPVNDRVRLLMEAMTLEEKIGQMWQSTGMEPRKETLVRAGQVGSFLNVSLAEIRALQKIAIDASRLGIPLITGRDVIHGYRTIFPIPLGQAASFNPEIAHQGARIAAKEAAVDGVNWTFAPMVDISRDPRWGRIAESLGEDPLLAARLGAAMVAGFQGDDPAAPDSIAACAKHYVGYGAAEGGRDYNTTLIPEGELRNVYLEPFHACAEAGALSFMSAFNDLNGIPTSGNRHTIRGILKTEWEYPGMVVSDWGSIIEMIPHGYAADPSEAAERGIAAGVDMEMVSECYPQHAAELLQSGKLKMEWIDDSVARILRMKFVLGLFEQPYPADREISADLDKSHLEAARKAAVESCVLLKNDAILPLKPASLQRVAVIGPMADNGGDQLGCWVPDGDTADSVTPLTALREALPETVAIDYAVGLNTCRSADTNGFAQAVAAAKAAEVAVLFLGEDAILSGEAHSRAFLNLPGAQKQLLEAVAAIGTPVVLVLMAGRPLILTDLLPHADALLYAWHPGTMGGPAITDLLLNLVAPSGKLPVSFPAMEGQIPVYYNKRNTGRPADEMSRGIPQGTPLNPVGFCSNYLDGDHLPLFPFGFGLTYTEFSYKNLTIRNKTLTEDEILEASIELSNDGTTTATEIVQLYVQDCHASLTRPVRELKDFRRVTLRGGEHQTVAFHLPAKALSFYDNTGQRLLEAGEFRLWIGGDSRCESCETFTLKVSEN